MNKELSKAIMIRTKMGNKFKNRSHENRENFNKQRNYCVQLVRKSKREYYGDFNEENATDNKTFWKTVKLFFFFLSKTTIHSKITLVENDEVVNTLSTGLFMWMLLNYGTMNIYTNFFSVSIDFKTHISNFKIFAQ